MSDLRTTLFGLVNDEKAFLAACQKHMGLRDVDMHRAYMDLTSKGGAGGEDVRLANTFLRFLADTGVNIHDLAFSHPQWEQDLLFLSRGEKGAAWYGTTNQYCRALLRHLSGNDMRPVSRIEPEELADEQIKTMTKDEFFDLVLFSGFSTYRGDTSNRFEHVRTEYWERRFFFGIHRYATGQLAKYFTSPPPG